MEYEDLFGDAFHEVMVKAARDANALKSASTTGRIGGPNPRPERGYRGDQFLRGSHSSNPGSYSGRGSQGGSQRQNPRYLPSVWSHEGFSHPVGGRLKFFAGNWLMVSRDPWVLEIVNHGLEIEFVTEPVQSFRPGDVRLGDREAEICDQEITSLLEKNAIEVSSEPHQTSFLSSFFVIPKKGGKYRPVHNLRKLNRFVVY